MKDAEEIEGAYENQHGVEVFIAPLGVVVVPSRRYLPVHHIEIETVIAISIGGKKISESSRVLGPLRGQ